MLLDAFSIFDAHCPEKGFRFVFLFFFGNILIEYEFYSLAEKI